MLPKVIEVSPEAGYRLRVKFSDGVSGIVDMSRDSFRGVFAPLRDEKLFAQAFVEYGAVTWPNGVDLAPDAMHTELQKEGVWILAD